MQSTVAMGAVLGPAGMNWGQVEEKNSVARYSDPATYEIEHQGTVTNGSSTLSTLELWLPMPLTWPEQQVSALVAPPDVLQYPDATGTAQVARYYATRDLPGEDEKLELVVSYCVTSSARATDHERAKEERFADYRVDDNYRRFTRSEKLIQVANQAIVQQAAALRADHATPYAFARAAYDWILDRTEYRLHAGPKGAQFCIENRSGECGEYSMLFVALCRAVGIPARPIVGCWADEHNGWHIWAEFMLPSGAWIPVDGSCGDHASPAIRNANFGSLDNRRVVFSKTCDVHLQGVLVGKTELEFLQIGAWWWYASHIGRRPHCQFHLTGNRLPTTSND